MPTFLKESIKLNWNFQRSTEGWQGGRRGVKPEVSIIWRF